MKIIMHLFWFIHISGICLWFGVMAAVLMVWPSANALKQVSDPTSQGPKHTIHLPTLTRLVTRVSHVGAGLTALGGTLLSLFLDPKSKLAAFWLVTMQGLGVCAFVISIFVMTRSHKKLVHLFEQGVDSQSVIDAAQSYRGWLLLVVLLLVLSLLMASFKPVL